MATHRTRPRVNLPQLTRSEGIAGAELQACGGGEIGLETTGEAGKDNAGLVLPLGTRQPGKTADDSCLLASSDQGR